MKDNCLDIGIIQAFLDGELAHAESARVSSHIALCDGCASTLAEAENESAMVFSALDREFNTLVPTQRLWNKINDSIETQKASQPFWHRALAFLTAALANPSFAAAAGVIIVVGIFAIFFVNRAPVSTVQPVTEVATTSVPPASELKAETALPQPVGDLVVETARTPQFQVERASYRASKTSLRPAYRSVNDRNPVEPAGSPMPGEESYVKTIASLSKTVEGSKDDVMRPSQRISYERDMAVVNDAIAKMRKEVSRNPKNESARQVLYTSYQNKIDLLNSVSQKEELMASINR
jgi:hypothetical protein